MLQYAVHQERILVKFDTITIPYCSVSYRRHHKYEKHVGQRCSLSAPLYLRTSVASERMVFGNDGNVASCTMTISHTKIRPEDPVGSQYADYSRTD